LHSDDNKGGGWEKRDNFLYKKHLMELLFTSDRDPPHAANSIPCSKGKADSIPYSGRREMWHGF
jgi:hypothetical protein